MMNFKKVPKFSNYRVNTLGQVWSDKRNQLMKGSIKNNGYRQVTLTSDEGGYKNYSVHQVVAMTFLGHKPNGLEVVVDHINHNKLDNRLENLQLISNRENLSKDSYKSKRSGLPSNITTKSGGGYRFMYFYVSKQFAWSFKTLDEAIEMSEMFNYLKDVDGEEYALKTLDENRRGYGRQSKAERNGDTIVIR